MEDELKEVYQALTAISYPTQTPEQEKLMKTAENAVEALADTYGVDVSV